MNGFNNFNLAGARSLTEEINPMQVNLTLTCKQCEIFIGNSSNILMMKFLGREFFKALREILPSHNVTMSQNNNGRLHFLILKVIIRLVKDTNQKQQMSIFMLFLPLFSTANNMIFRHEGMNICNRLPMLCFLFFMFVTFGFVKFVTNTNAKIYIFHGNRCQLSRAIN